MSEVRPQGSAPPTRRKGKRSIAWRADREILARIAEVDRRHLTGQNFPTIAAEMGISESTAKEDVRRATALFRERRGENVETERGKLIRRLEEVASSAYAAYLHDTALERAVLLGEQVDGLNVHYDQKGSARFSGRKDGALNVMRQALMDIAKLQGLVVDKVAQTDGEGKVVDLASLVLVARQGRE